tara:strand:+ start:674 stop:820 length:147 start_codon:yes stop_codon:yes gene_type:complete
MKIDLTKLISSCILGTIAYMVYIILADIQYLTSLIHAYISMAMEIVKH